MREAIKIEDIQGTFVVLDNLPMNAADVWNRNTASGTTFGGIGLPRREQLKQIEWDLRYAFEFLCFLGPHG
jgi:hypothetical protein